VRIEKTELSSGQLSSLGQVSDLELGPELGSPWLETRQEYADDMNALKTYIKRSLRNVDVPAFVIMTVVPPS
jgi:hypothetical protein